MVSTEYNHDPLAILEKKMKGKRGLDAAVRKMFINSLRGYDSLKVVKGKPVLNTEFYRHFIKSNKIDDQNNSDENGLYKFFSKLKKYGLVHQSSAFYPKKLSIISINPNVTSLHKVGLSHIDSYIAGRHSLYHNDINGKRLQDAYIDLRLYQASPLYASDLMQLKYQDIIVLNDEFALLYLEHQNLLKTDLPTYKLVAIYGKELIEAISECAHSTSSKVFPKAIDYEKLLLEHRRKRYGTLSISAIRMTGMNNRLFYNSPLHMTIMSSPSATSPTTLAEVEALYPGSVPKHLMEVESNRIKAALSRPDSEDGVLESDRELFSIEEFGKLQELIKSKTRSEARAKITAAKSELKKYLRDTKVSNHIRLIASYLLYLLERYDHKEKMALGTLKGYIGLLNKHLFLKVENLSIIQSHELTSLINDLERLQYKHKSILKIRALIRNFFYRANIRSGSIKAIHVNAYPKSLILDTEIDAALDILDKKIRAGRTKLRRRIKFRLLQLQTILLVGFYTGLRKSELRSRLLEDFYFYDNKLFVDVNSKGLKKLGLALKTSNAKRRVCATIDNETHLEIIKSFLSLRQSIENRCPFLFLRISKDNTIRSKAIDESIFDDLTTILQELTARYVSFHSLRHSYATYEVKKILDTTSVDPYLLMDLAVRMGHESPMTTLKVYTHFLCIDKRGANAI